MSDGSDLELLFQLMALMSGGWPQSAVDAVFVFGRAIGDYEAGAADSGILETAAQLYRRQLTRHVVIPGQGPGVGVGGHAPNTYPGEVVFRTRLLELQLPDSAVIATEKSSPHTRGEGDAFVNLAVQRGWMNVVVLCHPHQALRAMLGLMVSLKISQSSLRLRPVWPASVDWKRSVNGSQGGLFGPRHEHIAAEWSRILRYQQQGDLASFEALSAYLLRT